MHKHRVWVENIRALLTTAGLAGGNVERERAEPTRDEILPIALVAFEKDIGRSDGDARHGAPGFVHEATVEVVHFARADTGPLLRAALYDAAELVTETLLPRLHLWGGTDEDGVPLVEAISGVEVAYQLPPEGEHIVGSVAVKLRLLHRTIWPAPPPGDDFATVSTAVAVPPGTPQPGIIIDVPTE